MNRYLVIPIRKKPALDGRPVEYVAEIETEEFGGVDSSRLAVGFGRTPTEAIRNLFNAEGSIKPHVVERYVNESLGFEEAKP